MHMVAMTSPAAISLLVPAFSLPYPSPKGEAIQALDEWVSTIYRRSDGSRGRCIIPPSFRTAN